MWGSQATTSSTVSSGTQHSSSRHDPGHFPLIPVAAQGGDAIRLGGFEDGLDGWKSGDRVTLDRVGEDSVVATDSTALRLTCTGAVAATVRNGRSARDANWNDHPFLTATVTAGELAGTDAPIRATFRLVHAAGRDGRGQSVHSSKASDQTQRSHGAGGRSRHGSLTSEPFSVPKGQPVRLYWDLSDVDQQVRDAVVNLEIVCERADQPVSEGPYGRHPSSGIRGPIYLESVMLSDSPDCIATAKLQTHWQQLLASHGPHVETRPEVKKSSLEAGQFVFEEGAVPYDFEIRADGSHVFTLDGRRYRFEDGMAAVEKR